MTKAYDCDRCGAVTVRFDPKLKIAFCGLCLMHLETGVIGYGLKPAREGFRAPRWAHHLVR